MRISKAVLFATLVLPTLAQQPASIDPPAGEKSVLQLQGDGVQIYSCVVDNGTPVWKFVGPEASLTTETGSPRGKHSAGPTWKLLDGSEVKGSPVASKPSATQGAIPWLLLKVAAENGDGKLHNVEYITRTNTKGGAAPATGCDAAHQGTQTRIPYSATYTFYRK